MLCEIIDYDSSVKIVLTKDEAINLCTDDYSYVLSDLRDELSRMGFSERRYHVNGELLVRLNFHAEINALSAEEASELVLDLMSDGGGQLNISGDFYVGYADGDPEVDGFDDPRVEDVEILDIDTDE